MRKLSFLIVLLSVVLFACSSPQATNYPATIAPSESMPTMAPVDTALPIQTATPKFVPKQNDLLFIEFFAVT